MGAVAHVRSVFEIECRVDQRDMREGLGKVADQALALDVVLFRKQAEVVAQLEQAFKERSCILHAADGLEALTIQKLQARNTPSPGGRPSSTFDVL